MQPKQNNSKRKGKKKRFSEDLTTILYLPYTIICLSWNCDLGPLWLISIVGTTYLSKKLCVRHPNALFIYCLSVMAMEDLARSFNSPPSDWIGDPCLPQMNSWTGITCNQGKLARVVTLWVLLHFAFWKFSLFLVCYFDFLKTCGGMKESN